jgi:hypothetical protein
LRQFSPEMIGPGETVGFIGKRKTGKSTAMLDIMYHKRRTPAGIVVSGTAETNDTFSRVVPEAFIYSEWNPNVVESIIEAQESDVYARHKAGLEKIDRFFVIDDQGYDDKFCNSKMLRKLLMNGRHIGFQIFVALQDALSLKPALRNQLDWIIIHREIMPTLRRRLYEHIGELFGTFDTFCDVLDRATESFGTLVFRNSGQSSALEDIFFHWRPTIRDWRVNTKQRPWHMGSTDFWKYHTRNFDEQWNAKRRASTTASKAKGKGKKARGGNFILK